MKEELSDYLIKRFPKFFRDPENYYSSRALNYGIECDDGWFNIINSICLSIESYIKSIENENEYNGQYLEQIAKKESVPEWIMDKYKEGDLKVVEVPNIHVTQVKEKFGTLRFYYKGRNEYVNGIINMGVMMSKTTCEVCGQSGQLRGGGWLKVLCDKHHVEKNKPKSSVKSEAIVVGSELPALTNGAISTLEVVDVISQEEVKAKLIHVNIMGIPLTKEEKASNKLKDEYFLVKYVKNDTFSYWNAEKIDI